MARVLCVCNDLIFATKIRGTAAAVGCDLVMVGRPEQAGAHLGEGISTVIVDLAAAGEAALPLIRDLALQADAPHVIAYLPHAETALAASAREAGAHEVMPRLAFTTQLPAILADA